MGYCAQSSLTRNLFIPPFFASPAQERRRQQHPPRADTSTRTNLFTASPRLQRRSFITGGAVSGEKIHYRCLTLRGTIKLRTVTCSSFFVPRLAGSRHKWGKNGLGECLAENRLQNPISKAHVIYSLNVNLGETREFEKRHSALESRLLRLETQISSSRGTSEAPHPAAPLLLRRSRWAPGGPLSRLHR